MKAIYETLEVKSKVEVEAKSHFFVSDWPALSLLHPASLWCLRAKVFFRGASARTKKAALRSPQASTFTGVDLNQILVVRQCIEYPVIRTGQCICRESQVAKRIQQQFCIGNSGMSLNLQPAKS